jgi:hypothetical protein
LNGHKRIRRKPNFVDRSFLSFSKLERNDYAHLYGIRHIAALSLGTPAFVQAQVAPSQSEAQKPPAQSRTVIERIQVVDVKDLKPEVRSKIDNVVAHTSEEDMQSLRKSIDATPDAASALKAKGLSSSQVIAINIAEGVLTLITKTA